ncbi:MAG: 2-C-methyl-D-erythritol 4-phosphate cytidylyltransferase [Candidatus Coatesbacteria bacterium]|nr:2-C-methyl-D-erythritol 4-phosphate cytidylyltransferase [Candidatus Coatesbacteria bacterium]
MERAPGAPVQFVSAIVVAGGSGERMGSEVEKPFIEILGVPMLFYSMQAIQDCEDISEMVLVVFKGGEERLDAAGGVARFPKLTAIVEGGPRRQDSVFNGLAACDDRAEIVAVHDAARPMLRKEWLNSGINALGDCAGAIFAAPLTDTIKRSSPEGIVLETVPRDGLYAIQTPQIFTRDWLFRAHSRARLNGTIGTDDAALVEEIGGKIKILPGPPNNLKVTYQDDLLVLKAFLEARK